jgi:hypothetical protein
MVGEVCTHTREDYHSFEFSDGQIKAREQLADICFQVAMSLNTKASSQLYTHMQRTQCRDLLLDVADHLENNKWRGCPFINDVSEGVTIAQCISSI